MKQRTLLLLLSIAVMHTAQAQQARQAISGYAITAADKGGRGWKEVRMMDMASGSELKMIYSSKSETPALNARTGKPVVKKELAETRTVTTTAPRVTELRQKKTVNLDEALHQNSNAHNRVYTRVVVMRQPSVQTDQPFATSSAAMAYDKKHNRLYYTPMFINQLRYIDLKSGKVYFLEDEAFGAADLRTNPGNQITRMTMGADGSGYALTNDASQLIRFTTGKKPVITHLGAIADDAADERSSIRSRNMYGGDMVADAAGNLYLVTASRHVFKINIENRTATRLGQIKGLPAGFSTNGAMVEEDSKVIIASSESTVGYYRFDLNTLQAEKISADGEVFNASDLANGILAFDKKKKNDEPAAVNNPVIADQSAAKGSQAQDENGMKNSISVYPNPVTDGVVRISFANQPEGRYQVQLLDLSGRLIAAKEVNINGGSQIEAFRFPELSVKGNYLLRISSEVNKVNVLNKLLVQ